MDLSIEIKNESNFNNLYLNIKINTSEKKNNIVNDYLSHIKNKITKYSKSKQWDFYKKMTNPYELIYLTKKIDKEFSISKYEPISRSYFKMIEILNEYFIEYKNYSNKIKTFHLAEGPGGFVEAMINFRNNSTDEVNTMTLISNNKEIPNWNKIKYFIKKNKNINIIIGEDKKGDLYNIKNHYYILNNSGKNSMDIITGDGGFDFSNNYNFQEQNSQKLIFSQILMVFSMLKKNGHFICKFFDTYCDLTKELIFLLYLFFDSIYIYKPKSSRIANSERYIICKKFKGCSTLLLCELINILNIWNKIENLNYTIIKILDLEENKIKSIYIKFLEKLNKINNNIQTKQIENINKTIDLIENKPNHIFLSKNYMNQINKSKEWCVKYNVPYKYNINTNYTKLYYLLK